VTDLLSVQPADYSEITGFLASSLGDTRSPEFWSRRMRTWWEDNPAFDDGCARGWLIRASPSGEVVGFIGNVPSIFQVNFEPRRVFAGTTFRVMPEYRGSSVELHVAQVARHGESWLFNTTANAKVERILEYLKFRSLPSHRSKRRLLLPLDAGQAMRAYLQDKLAAVPDALAGFPLAVAQLPLQLRLRERTGDVRVLEAADESFDDLWARTRRRYANTSVRTSAVVQWMCFANPATPKTLVASYEGDALAGYAIFADARWRGLKVLDLVDLWTDGPREATVPGLLAAALEHARARDYAVIALYDFDPGDAAVFRKLGVLFWAEDTARHYYRPPDPDAATLEIHESYLTGFEGDRFL